MNDATPIDSAARDSTVSPPSAIPPVRTTALRPVRSRSICLHTTASAGCAATRTTATPPASSAPRWRATPSASTIPDRLLKPLIRAGAKGEGQWKEASFEAALDLIAEKFEQAEAEVRLRDRLAQLLRRHHGAGAARRDPPSPPRQALFQPVRQFLHQHGLDRLYHGRRRHARPDPREMAKSDCVVIWGTNAVSTQVNVMTHAIRARKERGAKIVVIDIYDTPTMKQADIKVLLKPGTDGAFACAVMHVLFREGLADRDYLNKFSDDPAGLESHLKDRTPEWAEAICGVPVAEIEAFRAAGRHHETDLLPARLRFHPAAQRRGQHACGAVARGLSPAATSMRVAARFIPIRTSSASTSRCSKGRRHFDPGLRWLDQSKIGRILTADAEALGGGPPVTAMLVQNTNPANVAPEQRKVIEGLKREDLFLAVHEQFMTDTAQLADVVLPATMFLEHDDIYRGGGHQHIMLGPKLVDPPEGPMSRSPCRRGAWRTPWRCRPRRLRPDRAPAHRHDAAKTGPGRLRQLQGGQMGRCPVRFRNRAFPHRLCPQGWQVPLPARLDRNAGRQQAAQAHGPARASRPAARVSRSCRTDRKRRCGPSVPAGDIAIPLVPQLDFCRNAIVEIKGKAPGTA
jgi:hypothetical protein